MIRPREARFLLDHLCGMTMRQIADRENLHLSRVGQIITKAKNAISWHPGMTKQQVGAKCCRRPSYREDTPKGFYATLEREQVQKGWSWKNSDPAYDE